MNKMLFVAALLAGFLSAPALAQTRVGDWTVEKRAKDTHCNASRGYKDKQDENRDYAIVLTYSTDKIVIVLITTDGSGTRKARSSERIFPPTRPTS